MLVDGCLDIFSIILKFEIFEIDVDMLEESLFEF